MSNVIGAGVIEVSADARKLTAGIDEAISAAKIGASMPAEKPRKANADVAAELSMLDPADRDEAMGLLQSASRMDLPGNVRRYAQNRLDELLAPVRQVPTGEATELEPDETINADVAFMKFRTPEQIAADGMPPIPVGEATEIEPIPTGEAVEVEQIPVGEASAQPALQPAMMIGIEVADLHLHA